MGVLQRPLQQQQELYLLETAVRKHELGITMVACTTQEGIPGPQSLHSGMRCVWAMLLQLMLTEMPGPPKEKKAKAPAKAAA
jgi:hypothetical protein